MSKKVLKQKHHTFCKFTESFMMVSLKCKIDWLKHFTFLTLVFLVFSGFPVFWKLTFFFFHKTQAKNLLLQKPPCCESFMFIFLCFRCFWCHCTAVHSKYKMSNVMASKTGEGQSKQKQSRCPDESNLSRP